MSLSMVMIVLGEEDWSFKSSRRYEVGVSSFLINKSITHGGNIDLLGNGAIVSGVSTPINIPAGSLRATYTRACRVVM